MSYHIESAQKSAGHIANTVLALITITAIVRVHKPPVSFTPLANASVGGPVTHRA